MVSRWKGALLGPRQLEALEDVNTKQRGELCCSSWPLQEFTQQGCCYEPSDSESFLMWIVCVKEKGGWLGLILRQSRAAIHPVPYLAWICGVCLPLRIWAYGSHLIREWTWNYISSVLPLEHGACPGHVQFYVQYLICRLSSALSRTYLACCHARGQVTGTWGLTLFLTHGDDHNSLDSTWPGLHCNSLGYNSVILASAPSQSIGPAASLQWRTIPLCASIHSVPLAPSSQKELGIKEITRLEDQWSCFNPRTIKQLESVFSMLTPHRRGLQYRPRFL